MRPAGAEARADGVPPGARPQATTATAARITITVVTAARARPPPPRWLSAATPVPRFPAAARPGTARATRRPPVDTLSHFALLKVIEGGG